MGISCQFRRRLGGVSCKSASVTPNCYPVSAPEQIDVGYVAQLARMNLSPEEKELFQRQLSDVLHYIEKLQQADVSQVEATTHAIPVFNVFRDDISRDWFTAEDALSNAPRKANNLFIVPKVVE